ncbi:MAG TPA: decarboxylating 6-phosphogluconate dehydrogenase [archaeon]|nr:decarboxylating 6-phosphogluconate dehydrogenase [archaeon]
MLRIRIGFIGLGKMGSRMAQHLLEKGHEVVLYARHPDAMKGLVEKGAICTNSYAEFALQLQGQKIILLMVTHGKPVDEVLQGLSHYFLSGDIVIDGGNSFYKDSMVRAKLLAKKGVYFLDAGTSGGLDGARNGASIMIGGDEKAYRIAEPVFKALAVEDGYSYLGPSGAGHFVKMVHNGVEYSLLQAYGEGYALLAKSKFKLDLQKVTKVYRHGSVIRSWLVDLLARSLEMDPKLSKISGKVGGGDTGKWTLASAKEHKIKMPILNEAMKARKRSLKKGDFSTKVVAALRYQFGGHEEPKK